MSKPRRVRSLRKAARLRYVAAAKNDPVLEPQSDPHPGVPAAQAQRGDPVPPPCKGREDEKYLAPTKLEQLAHSNSAILAQVPAGQSLTDYVRHLYESSAAPVRAIAALVQVSERTLYKYARKGNWRRRYAWAARGAAAAANRGRRFGPRAGFAPVKGAGGRFIAREDLGQPRPHGLKALDGAGAARACEACARARVISEAAVAQAKAAAATRAARQRAMQDFESRVRTLAYLTRTLRELAAYEAERMAAATAQARNQERAARADDDLRREIIRRVAGLAAREKERRESGA